METKTLKTIGMVLIVLGIYGIIISIGEFEKLVISIFLLLIGIIIRIYINRKIKWTQQK